MPVKVFLSYGHDRNTPLVERIGADLRTAGHTVWIDTSEIKGGDDWRRSIVDGLLDSDWALAFLSKHSTREPGVCLEEQAIALHVKGGTIATVLVEDESDVSPPVSVGHIQWLDMHDWEARQRTDPAAFETWYQEKLTDILRLLASPVTVQFAGEIAELDRRLAPITQEADIGPLVEGFVGRRWLLENLEAWRKGETRSRLFWLTGAPGTGKSAFAAWIAHYSRTNVIALNLCRYNSDDRRDPARVLRTLAFQIAVRVADYRQLLLTKLRTHDPDGRETGRSNAADLFDWLLAEPLRLCVDGGRRNDRYVIVIDALDETIRDGRSELAEVLAQQAPKLPEWIALVVTSRPEAPIVQVFAGLRPHWIDAESAENVADLRIYAQGWLGADGPIDRVVAAAAGNYQYLRKLREATDRGLIRLDVPEELPEGLSGLYVLWFRRQRGRGNCSYPYRRRSIPHGAPYQYLLLKTGKVQSNEDLYRVAAEMALPPRFNLTRHQHHGARTADRSDQDVAPAVIMSLLTRFHCSKRGQRARASRRATTALEYAGFLQ
jgi:hypothetical protein